MNDLGDIRYFFIFVQTPITLKSLIASVLLACVLASCNKKDDIPAAPVEKLYTNDSILVKDFTNYQPKSVERNQYHLLGYGYDVTGEYADSASARKQVFDVAKLAAVWPTSVANGRSNQASFFNVATQDAESLAYAISRQTEDWRFFGTSEQDSKPYYRKEIASYFPNSDAFSAKYVYGRQSIELLNRMLYFVWHDEGYLTPSFLADIKTHTPGQLTEKYGTHVLTRIHLGAKLTVLYQSETGQTDREKAAQLGFSVALAKTFGSFTGYLDHMGKQSAPGNFSQKIAFKATGGDVTKIKTFIDAKTGITRVDYSEWGKSTSTTSPEMIDIEDVVPVYEFIEDPVKKAEVKKYFEEYIAKHSPIVTK
jgi:hypothetical protein